MVGWPTSYIQAQCTGLHRELTRAIVHIVSLVNIKHYLCKLALRGHLNTDDQVKDWTLMRRIEHWWTSEGLNSITALHCLTRRLLYVFLHSQSFASPHMKLLLGSFCSPTMLSHFTCFFCCFFKIFFRCPTSYERAQNTRLHR